MFYVYTSVDFYYNIWHILAVSQIREGGSKYGGSMKERAEFNQYTRCYWHMPRS